MHIKKLFDLSGKVAIVTGGAVGLGKHMAEGLAESGAFLVVAARNFERCIKAAEQIQSDFGTKALAVKCNVSNPNDVKNLIESTLHTFGKIDILVNNAGTSWGEPAVDYSVEGWKKVIDVNLNGTFYCCQQAGKIMIKQGGGKIINIGSIAMFVGGEPEYMDAVGYQASKGAVAVLTKDLAVKWARYNINVNAIAPGWFRTDMTEWTFDQNGNEILRKIPMAKFGGDDDLKGAVIFLSSKASNYVTGHILSVDGGWTAV